MKLAIAAGLIACLAGAAMAQDTAPRRPAHPTTNPRASTVPYSYQEYGLESACSTRPFAPGCDKRGVW